MPKNCPFIQPEKSQKWKTEVKNILSCIAKIEEKNLNIGQKTGMH